MFRRQSPQRGFMVASGPGPAGEPERPGIGSFVPRRGDRAATSRTGAAMKGKPAGRSAPRHVSVVAVPDATVSTLFGIYDVMSVFERMDPPSASPFRVEIVGERVGPLALASGATI